MNLKSEVGFEDELTSPLHQLELQMALSNSNMKHKQSASKPRIKAGNTTSMHNVPGDNVNSGELSRSNSSNIGRDNSHQDGSESIYSFDLVSTNGRLLDRLYLDDDNNDDELEDNWISQRNSVFSNQSTGRLLDKLGLEDQDGQTNGAQQYSAPVSRSGSVKQKLKLLSSLSLLLLGSLSRRKSSRKHIPIQANASNRNINRTPSVPSNQTRRTISAPVRRNESDTSITSSTNSSSYILPTANGNGNEKEYTVGNVGSKIVHSDNKSIFSFQADMASLESVATISQKIPTPLSLPMTKNALDYASKRDTVDFDDYSSDIFGSSEDVNNKKVVSSMKSHHKHSNSLPEPNLDQLPQRYQTKPQYAPAADDLDGFQFSPSPTEEDYIRDNSTFVQSRATVTSPPLMRTQTEPVPQARSTIGTPKSANNFTPPVASSPASSINSHRSYSNSVANTQSPSRVSPNSNGQGRRIVSEPLTYVSKSTSSSSIASASASPNSKFSKTDLTPSARTAWATQLRNAGNHREALYQLQLAANIPNNYPKAMYLYAIALRFGHGVKLNERNAIKWLLRCLLVIQNTTDSQTQSQSVNDYVSKLVDILPEDLVLIMNRYLTSLPEVNPIELYDYYSKLSTLQLTKLITSIKSQLNILSLAYHEVGEFLVNGWGLLNKDEASGILYLSRAGSMGNVASMMQLGEIWSTKSKTRKKDYFKASAWLRLSELFGTKSIGNSWIYKEKYTKVTK